MAERFIGLDVGAETIKAAEFLREGGELRWTRRRLVEHHKDPGPAILDILKEWDWAGAAGAAVTGRLGRRVDLRRVPSRAAQAAGYRLLHGDGPATLVSIGSHGFSVLELRPNGVDVFRENSRGSQGTGNFLRQLVERLGLGLEEACRLAEGVEEAVPLSGRCPVILKTDMTHLANKGENRGRILAGLFDAVCENVQVLIKPRLSPSPVILFGGVTRARRVREHFRRFCARHGLAVADLDVESLLFLEAAGCARVAAGLPGALPALDRLVTSRPEGTLEFLPPLAEHRSRVRRMASLLRIADALDKEHREKLSRIAVRQRDGRVEILAGRGGELLLEKWALEKKADLFRRTFGAPVFLIPQEPDSDG